MEDRMKLGSFKISDKFWSGYQSLVTDTVIPFQQKVLNDAIDGVEKSHAVANFKIAAGDMPGDFYGMVFQDSDVAKWIEAASYSLALRPDAVLDGELDALIDVIGRAQQRDGYLNTYFTLKRPDGRWQDLFEAHELYCAGHMIEAGAAHYLATGKTSLLKIVTALADHICGYFGKDKHRGFPGHPEIELALVRLYRVTGEKKYLDLAAYFVDERGTKPDFFTAEKEKRDWSIWKNSDPKDTVYNQSHLPVREQRDAVGHAVRAAYLYTGMADLAREAGDTGLAEVCETLWNSITQKRMYVTGGIGSTHVGEAFTADYDLPNDTVYAETCASVALIFFAQRMLWLKPRGEYADVMERALYNCVLSGMQLDGKRFFYVNPLEVDPALSGVVPNTKHVLPERPAWFGCACCPPNLARLVASLGLYAWSVDGDTVYSHLFIGGELNLQKELGISIVTETGYPYGGTVRYTIHTASDGSVPFTLALRLPGWSKSCTVICNGTKGIVRDGYCYITRAFNDGDLIVLTFDMSPRAVYANLNVARDAGAAAVMRGPLVYCMEGVDNGSKLSPLRLVRGGAIRELPFEPDLLGGVLPLEAQGYLLNGSDGLYSFDPPEKTPTLLKLIPYYAWSNRGRNQMRVWIPEAE